MWSRVLVTEWRKIRTTNVWIPVLAAPLVTVLIGAAIRRMDQGQGGLPNGLSWLAVYQDIVRIYAVLFLPLLAGLLPSLCCRTEHLADGWKQLFAAPVTRTAIYTAKFMYALLFVALAQALVLLGVWVDGALVLHLAAPLPWSVLGRGAIGGWVATIPLVALQLWLATWWRSFAAPFALNVMCTIPATAVGGSATFAPMYPWSQPILAMLPGAHGTLLLPAKGVIVVVAAGVVFTVAGWLHFVRRDMCA